MTAGNLRIGFTLGQIRFWVAHTSRVLANASRGRELSFAFIPSRGRDGRQSLFGATPKPASERGALPGWSFIRDSALRARQMRHAIFLAVARDAEVQIRIA